MFVCGICGHRSEELCGHRTILAEVEKLLLQNGAIREECAKVVEAHKGVCKQMHDDCAAQIAAEIRGYIEKRK